MDPEFENRVPCKNRREEMVSVSLRWLPIQGLPDLDSQILHGSVSALGALSVNSIPQNRPKLAGSSLICAMSELPEVWVAV